jgi:hypothetical protein
VAWVPDPGQHAEFARKWQTDQVLQVEILDEQPSQFRTELVRECCSSRQCSSTARRFVERYQYPDACG